MQQALKIGLNGFPEREATVLRSMLRLIAAPLERELHIVDKTQADLLLVAGGGRAKETANNNAIYVRQQPRLETISNLSNFDRRTPENVEATPYKLSRPVKVHALQTLLHGLIHGITLHHVERQTTLKNISSNLLVSNTRAAELMYIFLRDSRPRLVMKDGTCGIWLSVNRGSCASTHTRPRLLTWLLSPVSDGFSVQDWSVEERPPSSTERVRTSWLRWHSTYFGVKSGWVDNRLMFQPLRLRRKPNLRLFAHGVEHRALVDVLCQEALPVQLLMAKTNLTEARIAPFLNASFMCGYLNL